MGVFLGIGTAVLAGIGVNVGTVAAATGALFTVTATTATAVGIASTLVTFGGIALSLTSCFMRQDFSAQSPTYSGMKQTQTNQDLPIPLLYGTCKLAGNRIWQDDNTDSTIKRIVAFAEGEVTEFSDIRLNDIPIGQISGAKVSCYYGTSNQVVDPIVGGSTQEQRAEKVGSLRNIAYLAVTTPRTPKIDMNYNLTAIVKGRKIRIYNSRNSYYVQYSENPAWVMLDFLTSYNGLGLAVNNYGNISDELIDDLFDIDSFIEAAQFCDEPVNLKPRFTFNMVFDSQTSARDLIDEIYRSCRGGLFVKNGKLQFKIDKAEPVSKVFSSEDIIKGSETFETIPSEEHYDILKCEYISPEHEWQKVEAFAEIPEDRTGVPIEHSVKIYSCTNFEQASRLAWYYVNSKILQPYFGSFKTDYRAYDLEVGDVISFDSLLMGLENYKVKVTSVTDDGTGVYTVSWRTYDERLYSDTLGSYEPTVIISNIDDKMKYPDNVNSFNVVQINNTFSFVWEPTLDADDVYEIRMGDSWENGAIVAKKIFGTKYSAEISSSGIFKFWIKAFNGYNYSESAALDVISIDSVPNVNEICRFDLLQDVNPEGLDSNLKFYNNKIKLKEVETLWQTIDDNWSSYAGYYQTDGIWGGKTLAKSGVYESQVFDIGGVLSCILNFSLKVVSFDKENDYYLEWAFSEDNEVWSEWQFANTGTYTFRYCKFRITLNSYNNKQIALSEFVVRVDVPDKEVILELEITDTEGLRIEYSFIEPPSIVATVNDNNDAYVVVAEKTNEYAILKAYTNAGDLTTCKLSLRAKGF